jgi:hypothetical protein
MRPPGMPALNAPDHYSTDTGYHSPPDTRHHASAVDHAPADADADAAHATYLGANSATRVFSASDLSYLANADAPAPADADTDTNLPPWHLSADADAGHYAHSHPWSPVLAGLERLPSDAFGQPDSSRDHSRRRVRSELRYGWPGIIRAWRRRHRHWFAG